MRGEHGTGPYDKGYVAGSSPHARGALDLDDAALVGDGIIPACAGSTTRRPS